MTATVVHLLEEVKQLTLSERVEVRWRIIEGTAMSDNFTDESFAALAAESFRALVDEEAKSA